ncbi:MAG TPA: MFS transporter [Chloroflexota bacterium]
MTASSTWSRRSTGWSTAARSAFGRLWLSTTVSQLGTQVSELAVPFIAIVTLHATPFQIGMLMAVEYAPIVVFSLPAGAWVDRLPRRPLLIASDLGRAAILLSLPAAYALGWLSLAQLYVVGFGVGSLSVLFDAAYQSYLPALVDRDRLLSANSKLQISDQGASVVGPTLAGSLISLLTAPFAVAADAVSYLLSAGLLSSIRRAEPSPSQQARPAGILREISDGFRYVVGHPILRTLVMTSGIMQFFGRMAMAILLVYLVREVGLNAAVVGTLFSFGSVGFVLGALIAPHVTSRLGLGRTLASAASLASVGPLFYAISPRHLAGLFVAAGFFIYGVAALVWTVNSLSLRQAVTPSAQLGRTSATIRLLSWGAIPLGSVIGGLLGSTVGLRQTLVIGACGALAASLPVHLSRIRRLSSLDDVATRVWRRSAGPDSGQCAEHLQ